jgi:hypothetical protein
VSQNPASPATTTDDPLANFLHHTVVLDTQGPLIYIGTLDRITPGSLLLSNADVHDTNDSRASKDLYLVETRDLGVRINRAQVLIMRAQIASASLLADVRN